MTRITAAQGSTDPDGTTPLRPAAWPLVLGIETSCDETAVALVDGSGTIHSHHVLSQIDDHQSYGGVVPEIAARAHIQHLDHLIKRTLDEADCAPQDLDAVAATTGPGLIGGLMVGLLTGKALAWGANKPFVAINHLAAHALTVRLSDEMAFPYLLLLVSGGHAQILRVDGPDQFTRLGTTIDDAVGEAFDKTAKLLGLGYPGGPALEKAAAKGDPDRFTLPVPMLGRDGCNFSFSGLKTAVRRIGEALEQDQGGLTDQDIADIAAGFHKAITASILDRLKRAMALPENRDLARLVVAGGVAANGYIRRALEGLAAEHGYDFVAPPVALCTDNGAMIAWAGVERLKANPSLDEKDVSARPRWPLDSGAEALVGGGRKGPKA